MTDKILKPLSALKSYKKAQVTSIDTLISYVIFALFIVEVALFLRNLANPFESYVTAGIIYKNSESLKDLIITTSVPNHFIDDYCSSAYPNVVSIRASYEVKGLSVPFYDEPIVESIIGVHALRRGDTIRLLFNTNNTVRLDLVIPSMKDVTIASYNTENYDYYNKSIRNGAQIISIVSNNTELETDTYEVTIDDSIIVLFSNQYLNGATMYAGTTPFNYSCGEIRGLPKKSYYTAYAVMESLGALLQYGVDTWWE